VERPAGHLDQGSSFWNEAESSAHTLRRRKKWSPLTKPYLSIASTQGFGVLRIGWHLEETEVKARMGEVPEPRSALDVPESPADGQSTVAGLPASSAVGVSSPAAHPPRVPVEPMTPAGLPPGLAIQKICTADRQITAAALPPGAADEPLTPASLPPGVASQPSPAADQQSTPAARPPGAADEQSTPASLPPGPADE
jgi:hypothetical protein